MLLHQSDSRFAQVTGIYSKLVIAKLLYQRIKTIANTTAKVEQDELLLFQCVFLFLNSLNTFLKLVSYIVPVFIKVDFVIFVEDIPVQSLIILQFSHLLLCEDATVFLDDLFSVGGHFLVPLIVFNILLWFFVLKLKVWLLLSIPLIYLFFYLFLLFHCVVIKSTVK